jgi:hypothetical protein
LGLGFAGTVETEVNNGVLNPIKGYIAAHYFGAGIAAVALLIKAFCVRVKRDE